MKDAAEEIMGRNPKMRITLAAVAAPLLLGLVNSVGSMRQVFENSCPFYKVRHFSLFREPTFASLGEKQTSLELYTENPLCGSYKFRVSPKSVA
jgi:hypothetical protein